MRVYLAEKPSQANDIANVLGIRSRGQGFIEVTGGDKVTFARGHFYELQEPGEHNPAWGTHWAWSQLPMIPEEFKLKAVDGVGAQLKVIKALLKEADTCVIATDAGREGELIAREILEQSRFKGKILRFWTSTLTPTDIAHALKNLRDGASTYPLFEAARARRNSDFVHGNTLTRAATLAAMHRGDYYPVGRVQTPTLALVVRRSEAIKAFLVNGYYELEARVKTQSGKELVMHHAPEGADRITSKELAEQLVSRAQGGVGPLKVENASSKESPPLPYSLPQLQKEANAAFRFGAKQTLKIAQSLYEKKVISYPRTDCQHLGDSQKADIAPILAALAKRYASAASGEAQLQDPLVHEFAPALEKLRAMGVTLRDSVFNSARLTDHHGCIPTTITLPLEGDELKLYAFIVQRFLRCVAPDMLFDQTRVTMDANGVPFKATGRVITSPGFTSIKIVHGKGGDDDSSKSND